jgi:hypothetical protein
MHERSATFIHDMAPPSTRSDPIRFSPPRTKTNNNDDEIFHHLRPIYPSRSTSKKSKNTLDPTRILSHIQISRIFSPYCMDYDYVRFYLGSRQGQYSCGCESQSQPLFLLSTTITPFRLGFRLKWLSQVPFYFIELNPKAMLRL